MAKRKSKYGAVKTEVDGIEFASKAEASYYATLKIRESLGEISHLELQPEYPCWVNGVKVCTYKADFRYFEDGKRVIVDVKGFKTPVYRLKKKLVHALYPGTKIVEV